MRTVIFLSLFILSINVTAQYRPPGMRDMSLVRNISSALKKAMPWSENRKANQEAADAIDNNEKLIKETLKWTTNGGYLIRVKVMRNLASNATVALPPEFLGAGANPSDIVALASSQPSIGPAPDPNLIHDSERSFYIWVTQQRGSLGLGSYKLSYGNISYPFSEQVTIQALKKLANADVLENIKTARQAEVLNGITENLRRNVTDKAAAVRTAVHVDAYRKNLEHLNKLETDLKRDLKKIDQANQALNFINSMKNVLSIASLITQVSTAMEDVPSNQFKGARTPEDLTKSVESHKQRSSSYVEEHRRSIMIIRNNNNQERVIIINELNRMKVPSTVIDSGFSGLHN